MIRYAVGVLCFAGLLLASANGQTSAGGQKFSLEPVHVAAGAVLPFHLQTRLQIAARNDTDLLPKGTIILVRMIDPIDSNVDRDGAEFRGSVVTSIVSGKDVIIPAESEVRGLFVLLRSRIHPDGFRYELMVTGIRDHERSLNLTASLNSSFFEISGDKSAQPAAIPETGKIESPKENASPNRK